MSYIRAENILPKELIEHIQQYVSGANLYIPCKEKRIILTGLCHRGLEKAL